MKVTSKSLDNMCFVGSTEAGHSVVMEGAAAEGGVKRSPARWKCCFWAWPAASSIDVVLIAEKQRQNVDECQATVTAKRADDTPRIFTEIHIHFKVIGHDLKEAAIERAVQMSAEKYCSASTCWAKPPKSATAEIAAA